MKITFFITSLNAGGIETYLLRFLEFLPKDFQVEIICKGNTFGELENEYRKFKNVTLVKQKLLFFDVLNYFKLYKKFCKDKPDVVCDFTGNFAGIVLLVAKFSGINKRISFYRGSTNRFEKNVFKNFYNKLMNFLVTKYATKILSNSKAALQYFFPSKYKNYKVIYNGINVNNFLNENKKEIKKSSLGFPEDYFVVGHVGRVHFSKNHSVILEIAKEIQKQNKKIIFVLCGKGTKELIYANNLVNSNVIALDYRSDVAQVLSLFDMFLFPSVTEGQPNALIEAMLVNLPITASNIPSIKESTLKDFHRYLHNPNEAEAYVKDIIEFFEHSDEKKTEFKKLTNWAINFYSSEKWFNEFLNELK